MDQSLSPVHSRALGRVLLEEVIEEISDLVRKSWKELSRHSRTIHPSVRSSNPFAPDNTGLEIMRPAPSAGHLIARYHAVVSAIGIRQQYLLVISQKISWSLPSPVQGEIENIIGMSRVSDIHPHARR